jgi:hypothetical protein
MTMLMTDEQRAALKAVQDAFLQTHMHAQEVALATLEGQLLGLRNAQTQNVMARALAHKFWAWCCDGYFTGLEVALTNDYDLTLQKMAALRASMKAYVMLRGVGLHHNGKPIYWYSLGDDTEPQRFDVKHEAVKVLLPLLRQTKVGLHETFRQSTAANRLFPISWGLMMADDSFVLMEGYTRKDNGVFDYSVRPMADVFKQTDAA